MARDLNETDISNMPGGEFKATIVRMLTGFEKIDYISENLTTEIKKKFKKPKKNRINKIGNRLDAMNGRLEKAEE